MDPLRRNTRFALSVQRAVSRLLFPLLFLTAAGVLRLGLRYRVEGHAELRREYRRLQGGEKRPLMICANHLTMIDSFLVAWALGSVTSYTLRFATLPWNMPDRRIWATRRWARALVYVAKCIPIERGGRRSEVQGALARVTHLLKAGDAVLIFPEGGRSRSGRVDPQRAAVGVGRVYRAVPDCRVLCVYIRGRGQTGYSWRPEPGEHFDVALSLFEPKSDHEGLRGSQDVSRQIAGRLAEMERGVLGDR